MSRALKYDIPGPDRLLALDELREHGWRRAFAPDLASPKRLVIDVGFGRGEFLAELARREPESAFLGVEYSFKRVLKMRRRLARSELVNVRLVHEPAEAVLRDALADESVASVWINFPDPWPKKRHHRRRLVQPAFVRRVAERLEIGGELNVATDHPDYAEAIAEVLAGEPLLENAYAPDAFRSEVDDRPETAYEREWRAEGRPLDYFRYRRRLGSAA